MTAVYTDKVKNPPQIALVANTDWYLFGFRLDFAQFIGNHGYEVTLISPDGEYTNRILDGGMKWFPIELSRKGINPLAELKSFLQLVSLYRRERYDIIHHHTVKCVIYGSIAARLTKSSAIVNSITGLGHIFVDQAILTKCIRSIVVVLYRFALAGTTVIFQNRTDMELFAKMGITSKSRVRVIPGSGVDTDRFNFAPEPINERMVVVFPGRLLWEKGIGEFVEASRQINKVEKVARFQVVGRMDPGNPSSIGEAQLQEWVDEGIIEWMGWQEDMAEVFHSANIVCFPSAYGEGLPKVLIEAAACGRAIVTTDVPGCRDAVENGVNGILVPVNNSNAMTSALLDLIKHPERRKAMGASGRKKAEKDFASIKVFQETLGIYGGLQA